MKFPTCNRRAPAAPYYAALHSMNGGPEGRTTKSSMIWRLVKLITAQFYKKDNFSDKEYDNSIQRLHLVSSKIDHCTVLQK